MGINGGTKIEEIAIDKAFIGSCTNARIEDLREAARVFAGHKINPKVHVIVVPGSGQVKEDAEREGLDRIFKEAGCRVARARMLDVPGDESRHPAGGERCASTSNRNFEGRQGRGGRTHLVSPSMAAAAAVAGHFVDVRDWKYKE